MNQRILNAGYTLYNTRKTYCYYRPPANLNALMKYATKNGFWNAKSLRIHARSMRFYHFIPFFFTTGLLALLLVGLFEFLINHTTYSWNMLGLVIAIHLLFGLFFTIQSLKIENDGRKIVLPFVFFAFHFSYGWGTIKGFLKNNQV